MKVKMLYTDDFLNYVTRYNLNKFFQTEEKTTTINMICYFSCELVWDSVSTVFPLDKIHMKNNIS